MKYFVTTPIYYVNDKPHIGHIYTTIAADVLARYHRAKGDDVLFSTGTDENSQKGVEAAEREGKDVRQYIEEMAHRWEKVFKHLNFSHDVFIRTTSEQHERAVIALLKKIEEAGDIYVGDYEGYYCVGCEEFISENDLEDGKCPTHRVKPKEIREKNYFFKLQKYREPLLKHYKEHMEFVQPESARNKMLDYIEHEMEDISISRQAQKWGIRLPQDTKHAIYVWFDALINYLTVTGYPNEAKSAKWWPADVHLIGKDIIKFHCAIWPAMLLSAGLELPKQIFAHGFFTVDGQKISKSLGNAIDPLELTREYPFDAIRYYLLRDIPFGNDGDFSHQRLLDRYNADLANGLGNFVSRTLNMIHLCAPDLNPTVSEEALPGEIKEYLSKVGPHIDEFAFDKALSRIWKAIQWADNLIEEKKPWNMVKTDDKQEVQHVLLQLFAVIGEVNKALAPFMPDTHKRLGALLRTRPIRKPSKPLFARM